MGKKLDRFLGRGFQASKFKPLLKLAISRATVLRNQRRVRVSQSRSDVAQLLKLSHHDRALLRVEEVIREQNMLDVYAMVEGYCSLLVERVSLIEQEKFCPEELKEAVSSLIFVAPRCGDLPELQEVYRTLASRYGKEFAARAIELRNGCAVSPKIIQKLSARRPPLEIRTKLIREIASENGIALSLEDTTNEDRQSPGPSNRDGSLKRDEVKESDSPTQRMEFKDVADAAQVAFESAAYAAAAARAAVELSRSRSQSHHPERETSRGSRGEESEQSDEEPGFYESDDETGPNHSSRNTKGGEPTEHTNDGREAEAGSEPRLDLEKKPISVRTKHFRS
ncbi:hypothetical protein MLD38_011431 [Melastoma candidum]|uniref:Uncharacterized protein n=1 Tax=Melastoma candidum TaxID=119954 RepID=A0ACB9R6K6_9MYRT|nr:hypothetical protein MLD38_011431 [Melastoma candidum]